MKTSHFDTGVLDQRARAFTRILNAARIREGSTVAWGVLNYRGMNLTETVVVVKSWAMRVCNN